MTSDHNRSELGIHDHSNEPSSSKLVPKVVPLAVKTATSRQELELLFHHHIAMLRTTGINPMIQPESEDLPKDNPKLEIAVLRYPWKGKGPNWLFDLDYLTDSKNYQPVRSDNQANKHAGPKEANHSEGTQDNIDAGNSEMGAESAQDYFVMPIWSLLGIQNS
ncbi:hypothetical protein Tco_0749316 [Tanacetum coccineum]|uniref:Uncharacterized protein n=1 Tax=Tanacetum coccineum TaxID=301880 RepID=A0ABQ4YZ36_9ASTR